jgi:hypothetical protein
MAFEAQTCSELALLVIGVADALHTTREQQYTTCSKFIAKATST